MPSINAQLDDRAYDGIRLFCRANAVTTAGFLNALGEELAAVDDQRPPAWARRAVARGQQVDAERRVRRPD